MQQTERVLNVVAIVECDKRRRHAGRTLTVRLNSKASVKSVAVDGAASTFRPAAETRGDLQRIEIALAYRSAQRVNLGNGDLFASGGEQQWTHGD